MTRGRSRWLNFTPCRTLTRYPLPAFPGALRVIGSHFGFRSASRGLIFGAAGELQYHYTPTDVERDFIRRFGQYVLDMDEIAPPLEPKPLRIAAPAQAVVVQASGELEPRNIFLVH